MIKKMSFSLSGRLLAVAVGLASVPAGATAAEPDAASASGQKASGVATRPTAAVPKKTASTTKAAAAAASSAGKPVKKTASRRRAAPAASGTAVAEEAECYRRTAGRGRCEPQCLPYTRCRAGISSCRTGHENGPVTWFQCEQARGNTSAEPADGRVLVLGRNAHNMPTGHTLYVEKAEPRGDGRYALTLSHTNYDRRCNLETNMLAEYDPASKTIDVLAGKWERWGRDLRVAGFIHN